MADGLIPKEAAVQAGEGPRPLLVERPPAANPDEVHAFRFRMAYAALAVLLGAAVGGFIALVGRGSTPHQPWSSWKPAGGGFEATREIASFVGRQYRLPSDKELVAVIPQVPPVVQGGNQQVPISNIALAEGTTASDISIYSANNSIEYILCGVGGPHCSIAEGRPSIERGRLLHRESLELALYSFKYLGADSVVTFLPPRAGNNPSYALFFQKSDFGPELSHPLPQTLAGNGPFSPSTFTRFQQAQVVKLVSPHLFVYRYQQAQDGSAVLVLSPLPL